jgi:hypothetical protein
VRKKNFYDKRRTWLLRRACCLLLCGVQRNQTSGSSAQVDANLTHSPALLEVSFPTWMNACISQALERPQFARSLLLLLLLRRPHNRRHQPPSKVHRAQETNKQTNKPAPADRPGRRNGRHLHPNSACAKRLVLETHDNFEIYTSESPGPRAAAPVRFPHSRTRSLPRADAQQRTWPHCRQLPDGALIMFSALTIVVARSLLRRGQLSSPAPSSRPNPR